MNLDKYTSVEAESLQSTTSVEPAFQWPEGKRAAISLSFDDARLSQIDVGMALLNRYEVKATFYVSLSNVEQRLEGWRAAVAAGHEIGNHTFSHPCTGNFDWSRQNPLEAYTLERMRAELVEANRRLMELLGVTPQTFAYPCGQTFVSRGADTQSYVPLVAEMFLAGRGWQAECANAPHFCDLAQVMGRALDDLTFEQLQPLLEDVRESGQWLLFAGHEIGQPAARQTTYVSTLEQLLQYVGDPENELWIAPVVTVARYIDEQRRRGVTNDENSDR